MTGETEDNFYGKVAAVEPTADPIRFMEPITGRFGDVEPQRHWMASAGSLAGVWARENSREAIWDALARKEVFATTGTRMHVRVFGGRSSGVKSHPPNTRPYPQIGFRFVLACVVLMAGPAAAQE